METRAGFSASTVISIYRAFAHFVKQEEQKEQTGDNIRAENE
jgi:hypothetical protein